MRGARKSRSNIAELVQERPDGNIELEQERIDGNIKRAQEKAGTTQIGPRHKCVSLFSYGQKRSKSKHTITEFALNCPADFKWNL